MGHETERLGGKTELFTEEASPTQPLIHPADSGAPPGHQAHHHALGVREWSGQVRSPVLGVPPCVSS